MIKHILKLLFPLFLSLVSCSVPQERVNLFLYNQEDPFVKTFASHIKDIASDRLDLNLYDSQNSQIIQNEMIEKELTQSGVLIINPVDRLGAYSLIKKAKSLNIPVIFFNREPLKEDLELWDRVFYVGAHAEQSGQIQAQMVMDLFGSDPENLNRFDKDGDGVIEAVILKGEQGHQDAEFRTSELIRTFKEAGFKLEVLITEVANWSREEAYEKMKNILDNFGDQMELVLCNNDAMALGALSIMRQSGFFRDDNEDGFVGKEDDSWVPIVGIDGLDEAVEMIKEGYLYGSVLNDSYSQAQAIVELCEILLKKGDISSLSTSLEEERYIWIDYKILQ